MTLGLGRYKKLETFNPNSTISVELCRIAFDDVTKLSGASKPTPELEESIKEFCVATRMGIASLVEKILDSGEFPTEEAEQILKLCIEWLKRTPFDVFPNNSDVHRYHESVAYRAEAIKEIANGNIDGAMRSLAARAGRPDLFVSAPNCEEFVSTLNLNEFAAMYGAFDILQKSLLVAFAELSHESGPFDQAMDDHGRIALYISNRATELSNRINHADLSNDLAPSGSEFRTITSQIQGQLLEPFEALAERRAVAYRINKPDLALDRDAKSHLPIAKSLVQNWLVSTRSALTDLNINASACQILAASGSIPRVLTAFDLTG